MNPRNPATRHEPSPLLLLDTGHGRETPGKRSPDGKLREYRYTRELADRILEALADTGIRARRLVPEEEDIPLAERVRRADAHHTSHPDGALLLSLHCNAAGDGTRWMTARGWSVYVARNASSASRRLATCLAEAALSRQLTVRRQHPDRLYWTSGLYLCRRTRCPAVLIENLFQDNADDVALLLSEDGKRRLTETIVEGIRNFLSSGNIPDKAEHQDAR